jgi:coenzyme F420-reducing hydrogenase delta subunit
MIAVDEISDSIGLSTLPEEAPSKRIIIFGCARSAVPSAELASLEGHSLKLEFNLVAVPCAGSLSSEHLLKALTLEADGVLVLTCHAENCNAGSGNCLARDRVEALSPMLDQIGFDTRRLAIATLASNMGAGFAEMLNRFADQLTELQA